MLRSALSWVEVLNFNNPHCWRTGICFRFPLRTSRHISVLAAPRWKSSGKKQEVSWSSRAASQASNVLLRTETCAEKLAAPHEPSLVLAVHEDRSDSLFPKNVPGRFHPRG